MSLRHVLLAGVVVAGLAISGAGVASVLMDLPQDATPVPADPVGDMLRDTGRTPLQPVQPQTPPANGGQAPATNPGTLAPAQPGVPAVVVQEQEVAVQDELPEDLIADPKKAPRVAAGTGARGFKHPTHKTGKS